MREANSRSKRSFSRTILTKGFHVLVSLLCTKNVRDTQCGFKLFTRQSARILFHNLHLDSWAFDTEIIYLAETLKYPIAEVFYDTSSYMRCWCCCGVVCDMTRFVVFLYDLGLLLDA